MPLLCSGCFADRAVLPQTYAERLVFSKLCCRIHTERPRLGLRRVLGPYSAHSARCLLVSYMPLARLHYFGSATRQAQGRSAALKALSGIASIGSSASQRNWTSSARKHAIAHSPADSSTGQCRQHRRTAAALLGRRRAAARRRQTPA